MEALAEVEFITSKWKTLLEENNFSEEAKSATDPTLSTFQLVKSLIIEEPLEGMSDNNSQTFTIKSSVQSYFSDHPAQFDLKLFEHKLNFLTAFSVSLIQLARASNVCSERLMEHSLICSSEFWNPGILDKKYNHLKKRFIPDPIKKASLNELQKLFDEHKYNLKSIIDKPDQEALRNLIKDSNTALFHL